MTRLPRFSSWMLQSAVHSPAWPRILSEDLTAGPDPLALLLRAGAEASPTAVAALAARALIGPSGAQRRLPDWLAPHQEPAARRLDAMLDRYGGALLADAVGLGKSYVALAVALARNELFALVVPAVLVNQWRTLLQRYGVNAPILTHETLSTASGRSLPPLDHRRSPPLPESHDEPLPGAQPARARRAGPACDGDTRAQP